ncbi:hypothetical protein E5D57_000070 [Metarhizium anisopliae]|nr:hypothetical protein E5D57_000070 [Metarhizium anisopliae]
MEGRARDGGAARLLHAAHHHAQVARLHDDGDALGPQDLEDGVGHLLGEALLDLQAARKHLGDAGQLGDADDGVVRDVADVHLARKGHQVVLADRVDVDVLDNDHLGVALLEDGAVDNVEHVLLVAARKVQHGLGVALRRGQEALAVRVLAHALEDGADGSLDAVEPRRRRLGVLLQALAGADAGSAQPVKVDDGALQARQGPRPRGVSLAAAAVGLVVVCCCLAALLALVALLPLLALGPGLRLVAAVAAWWSGLVFEAGVARVPTECLDGACGSSVSSYCLPDRMDWMGREAMQECEDAKNGKF